MKAGLTIVALQLVLMGLIACSPDPTAKIQVKEPAQIKAENDARRRDRIDTFLATDRVFNFVMPDADSNLCNVAEMTLTTDDEYDFVSECTPGDLQTYSGNFDRIYDSDFVFTHLKMDKGQMMILSPVDSEAECIKVYFDKGPLKYSVFTLCDREI